jgi:phage terminase large subunit-like protein
VPLLKRLLDDPETIQSGGPSWANPHISPDFLAAVEAEHGGTRTGRQELEGKLIEDVEGALWSRGLDREITSRRSFDARCSDQNSGWSGPTGWAEGTCGIVVCGLERQGIAYVLADMSVSARLPENGRGGWAGGGEMGRAPGGGRGQ